ncbi:hypothetical protein HMPREF1621_05029 [Escherichia coli A25922R]|nr:hypothetical protein HMPREF1621_05029 [Escherichia coli A25922R]
MCFHLKIKSPSHNGRSEFTIDFNNAQIRRIIPLIVLFVMDYSSG